MISSLGNTYRTVNNSNSSNAPFVDLDPFDEEFELEDAPEEELSLTFLLSQSSANFSIENDIPVTIESIVTGNWFSVFLKFWLLSGKGDLAKLAPILLVNIKSGMQGYKEKHAKEFTSEQLLQFHETAPNNEIYLWMKVFFHYVIPFLMYQPQ
jgi:hypothetical protein